MGIHIMPPLYQVMMKQEKKQYTVAFYPDPHPEVSSVDGVVDQSGGTPTWAQLVAAAGTSADDSNTGDFIIRIISHEVSGRWLRLTRSIFLFDTTAIPSGAVIISATFALRNSGKVDEAGWKPNVNVYSSNPASNVKLAAGDFDSLGAAPFCDTPIAYDDWAIGDGAYNTFTLNAAGLAAIVKGGVTKLGLRNANYDAAGSSPSWAYLKSSSITSLFAERGAGYKPTLTVTYEV